MVRDQNTAKRMRLDKGSDTDEDVEGIRGNGYAERNGKETLSHEKVKQKKMAIRQKSGEKTKESENQNQMATTEANRAASVAEVSPRTEQEGSDVTDNGHGVFTIAEEMEWLLNVDKRSLLSGDTTNWMKLGPRPAAVICEPLLCSTMVINQLLAARDMGKGTDRSTLMDAIMRSNPYEKISSLCFMNRGALKMASVNVVSDYMFTNLKVEDYHLLHFADLCGGPGGFSEYILSRARWHAKGYGFTLRNANDFALDRIRAAPCETLHPFYGSEGNGDICSPRNQEEFRATVLRNTQNKGVHFVVADGGLVEDEDNGNENQLKQLYVCQCLTALKVLRHHGHFVVRLHELYTIFSAGLVYLMYKCFDKISIFKPNSSRSVNTERYLICQSKKIFCEPVIEYFSRINEALLKRDHDNDVIEIVPLDVLKMDEEFLQYLRNSNEDISLREILALIKVMDFIDDPKLIEPMQQQVLHLCPLYWDMSDTMQIVANLKEEVTLEKKLKQILRGDYTTIVGRPATRLTVTNIMDTVMNTSYCWYCMPCATEQPDDEEAATLYISLGRNKIYRYVKGKWVSIGDLKLELPADTLVYAEFLYESTRTGDTFTKFPALHIIDAYMLGGECVNLEYIVTRHKLIIKFCEALWKPWPNDYVRVRAKELIAFGPGIENRLRISPCSTTPFENAYEFPKSPMERDNENDDELLYFPFNSVIFLRSVVAPWQRLISRAYGVFYLCNKREGYSKRENGRPHSAESEFAMSFIDRAIWYWPSNSGLTMELMVNIIKKRSNEQLP